MSQLGMVPLDQSYLHFFPTPDSPGIRNLFILCNLGFAADEIGGKLPRKKD